MEYKKTYEIDHKIHARIANYLREYMIDLESERIRVSIRNLTNGGRYDNESIINTMLSFTEGSKIEIIALGYDKKGLSLKDAVEGLGGYFNLEQRKLNAQKIGVEA